MPSVVVRTDQLASAANWFTKWLRLKDQKRKRFFARKAVLVKDPKVQPRFNLYEIAP